MLNLWKKIQEKGHINTSPKRRQLPVSTLDPQYDGPLKGFEIQPHENVPLEKCHLTLHFDDICDNRTAYNYFKQFLHTRMAAAEILNLWSTITHGFNDNTHTFSYVKRKNSCDKHSKRSFNSCNSDNSESSTTSPSLNEKLFRLPDDARNRIFSSTNKCADDLTENDLHLLKPVVQELLQEYWSEFTHSEWYCRYQVDLLTSRSVTLSDILFHETALSYFMQFLEIEGCQSTLEFWLAATNFEQFVRNSINSSNLDVNQASNDAIIIYEKYLSLQATCPLGFADDIRCAVEEAICDEINGPHPDCFKPAVNLVLAFLRKHYLFSFFSSQHYVHLLSDMIRNSTTVTNHSPTSSVSEYSVESKQPLIKKLDPDSIWKRRKESGLSFGRIDQLGRFQRDIEPDPGRSNESKISKIVKKWVQRNENRISMEEEMAWQVAEMVVKDIVDLTMGCSTEADASEEDCFQNENENENENEQENENENENSK